MTAVAPVREEHVAALAPMLARAFDVDPYLLPDEARRLPGLTQFFSGNLRVHLRMLAETADGATPVQSVLTTHLRQNLTFYERAGFEVTGERTLEPPDGVPYTVWSTVRGSPPTRSTAH